jgi:hypothetical protein
MRQQQRQQCGEGLLRPPTVHRESIPHIENEELVDLLCILCKFWLLALPVN